MILLLILPAVLWGAVVGALFLSAVRSDARNVARMGTRRIRWRSLARRVLVSGAIVGLAAFSRECVPLAVLGFVVVRYPLLWKMI